MADSSPASSPTGSARATFIAAYSAVTLAQIANALPGALNGTFSTEFHTSGSALTWVASIFMVGIVVFELSWGLLGDLFGRKKLLYIGAVLSIIGSVVAALATTTGVMITAQAIGGLGAGILFPISLSMVAAITPDAKGRAQVIATWAGFLSLGAVISPVVAGLTSQLFTVAGKTAEDPNVFSGWRVSYYFAAAIALFVLIISIRAKDSAAPEGRKLDIPGQATLAIGLIAVLYATIEAVDNGFGATDVIVSYIIGAVLLVAFVIIEMRTKQPLVHLSLFRSGAYSITGIVAVIGMFAFLATCFSTSVAIGGLAQEPAWKVGVLFVFIQGPAFLFIPVVGWLIHRIAPRFVLTVGFVFMAAAGYWISSYHLGASPAHGGTPWTAFMIPLLLLGIGFALTVGSITAVAINTVEPTQIGMASATTNLLRDLGFALGSVVGSAIAFSIGASLFTPEASGMLTQALQGPTATATAQGLAHIPPLGWLSGYQGIVAQAAGQAAAHGGSAASSALTTTLTAPQLQGELQGAAGSSLGTGFHWVYLSAGVAATVSAVLTLFIPGRSAAPNTQALAELTEGNAEAARA